MTEIPLSTLLASLAALLVASAFFSMAETAMMAANRYRLRFQAKLGSRGAKLALSLLDQTDKLLGVILLGNTLINAVATALATVITARAFGQGEFALMLASGVMGFTILIFSEITPKVIGAAYADRIVPPLSYVLVPLLRLAYPAVWAVNLVVQGLLKLFRLKPEEQAGAKLSQEELRSVVLEGHYFRGKHRTMLANLFDLEAVTVDDVMTPRSQIEALNLKARPAALSQQVATTYHTRLPVYDDELDNVVGLLQLKNVLPLLHSGELDAEHLRAVTRPPYFVPAGTPLLKQLQQFQSDRQRLGLVVDEYGELQGLVTLEDILEEIVGEFTTQSPGGRELFQPEPDGSVIVDGMAPLRTLNRKLHTEFPLDGPKTLNGLILEHLGDIPDAGLGFRIGAQAIEVLQVQDRAVKVVRLVAPVGVAGAPALQTSDEQASSIK